MILHVEECDSIFCVNIEITLLYYLETVMDIEKFNTITSYNWFNDGNA